MIAPRLTGIAIVFVTSSNAAADPVCKPSARVSGEGPAVAAITPLLRERGIEVLIGAVPDSAFVSGPCKHVSAEVVIGGGRIMVWITDAEGRRAQRMAEDAEAAATVIESWARGDLVDPLLATRQTIVVGSTELAGASSTRALVLAAGARPRYLVTGGGDVGVSGDGALWAGARAQGCGMVGSFCVGGAIRYATDLERSGDTQALGTSRTALGLALIGELPLRRGSFTLFPGVGVGLTSVTARNVKEGELEQASAIHARAALAGAYDMAKAWSLRVDVAAEVAPFARTRLGDPDGVDHQLAASPRLQTWLGISIAYGGR